MKLLFYIFLINNIHKVELYYIQSQNKPICANCKFFISNNNECSKFGDLNLITGEHIYETAASVRNDSDKCSEDAIFFEQNYFKFITIPYNFIVENYKIFFFSILNFLPLILWYSLFIKLLFMCILLQ